MKTRSVNDYVFKDVGISRVASRREIPTLITQEVSAPDILHLL